MAPCKIRLPGLRQGDGSYKGPYPILKATLNLAHGDRLARQERKAASFVFTPRYCGYHYTTAQDQPSDAGRAESSARHAAYRPTVSYAYPDGGVHLGTA